MKTNYKKILSISALTFATLLGVVSCKDEVLVPVKDNSSSDSLVTIITGLDGQKITLDTKINELKISNTELQDSLNNLDDMTFDNSKIEYTVNLINAGTSITNGRTKGVDGVTVKVIQNGATQAVTSADGRAIFKDLTEGYITVQISLAGYAGINASVYLDYDNTGSNGDGAIRSASSNFLVIPIGGTDGLTISGKMYINNTVLDDTLGRQYNKAATPQYTTFISNRSEYEDYNYTGWDYGNLQNIYGGTQGYYNVKFAPFTTSNTVYAYPNISSSYLPSNNTYNSDAGYITSVTYTGLISYSTVDNTGAYSLKVPYILNGAADGDVGYYIYAKNIDANLSRFDDQATSNGTTQGTPGAVKTTFKSFNTTTYATTTTDRFVISDSWKYYAGITLDGGTSYVLNGYNNGWDYNYTYVSGELTSPGATIKSNIYYFPLVKN